MVKNVKIKERNKNKKRRKIDKNSFLLTKNQSIFLIRIIYTVQNKSTEKIFYIQIDDGKLV